MIFNFRPTLFSNFTRVFLICLFIAVGIPQLTFAEVVDKVVAVVNADIITLSELEDEVSSAYRSIARDSEGKPKLNALSQARESALNNMIDQRLIEQKAKEFKVGVSTQEIDNAMLKTRNRMSLSPAEFNDKLKESGLSEELYRKKLRTQILQSKVINIDVRSRVVITDEMMRDYFDKHYKSEVIEGGYYLLQIGFTWKKSDSDNHTEEKKNTRKRAERIYTLAQNGQNFKELAKKFSELPSAVDGGDIGVFTLDEMAESMRNGIAPLKPGEISQIVEASNSYQFFKVLSGGKEAVIETSPYEDAKEEIRQKIGEEKLKESFSEWVKKLKDDAYIQKLKF